MGDDAEGKQPPMEKKAAVIEEGEPVVILTHKVITDYNRYVKVCMDKHKEKRDKEGQSTSFEDAKDLIGNCAEEWNKLSPEEKKKYGDGTGTS